MTGNLIDEPKLMAILLNELFSSVFFTTEDQTNIPSLHCEVELMADITITAAEVQNKLQNLRTDKAPGADLIHPTLLKELAVQVAYPLGIIFQQSIDQTRVPPNNGEQLTSSLSSRKGANAIRPTTDQSV